jgi:hypothetical protein
MVGVITAVVAIGATVYSVVQQSKAAKANKKANERAARIEAFRSARERGQALRQNRITAADLFARAANAGVAGSSGVQGALASQGSQAASELTFANQIDALNQERLRFLQRADSANANAALGGQIASIAGARIGG